MTRFPLLLCASLLAGLSSASAQIVTPNVINVNCSSGGTIQDKLTDQTRARPLEIIVTGICSENLDIRRDDVIIRGAVPGTRTSTVRGRIEIKGSTLVRLKDLKVQSSGGNVVGVKVFQGSAVDIDNVLMVGHRAGELAIVRNSVVKMEFSRIAGHVNAPDAVFVGDGSTLRMRRTIVTANAGNPSGGAVTLSRKSLMRLDERNVIRHLASANTDTNLRRALGVYGSSTVRSQVQPNNIFDGNLQVGDLSGIDLRDTTVTGNAIVYRTGILELRNSTTFSGDIGIFAFSIVDIRTPATIGGTVTCGGGILVGSGSGAVTANGC